MIGATNFPQEYSITDPRVQLLVDGIHISYEYGYVDVLSHGRCTLPSAFLHAEQEVLGCEIDSGSDGSLDIEGGVG